MKDQSHQAVYDAYTRLERLDGPAKALRAVFDRFCELLTTPHEGPYVRAANVNYVADVKEGWIEATFCGCTVNLQFVLALVDGGPKGVVECCKVSPVFGGPAQRLLSFQFDKAGETDFTHTEGQDPIEMRPDAHAIVAYCLMAALEAAGPPPSVKQPGWL